MTGATLTKDTVPPFAPDISKLTVSNNLPAVADGLVGISGAVEASATVSAFGSEPSSSTIALSVAQADASGAFPSVSHTDEAGNSKGEFTGVSAVKDTATTNPTATSIRVKSGSANEQDAINLASRSSVYVDVGFATAPGETGLLSVRLTSSGVSGTCSEVSGSVPVTSSIGTQTNIVVGPMNASCLADGVVTISAQFTDSSGNVGASVIGTTGATKDTVAPQPPSLTAMTLTNNAPGTADSLVVQSSVGSAGDTTEVWRDATFTSLISSGPASAGLTVSLGDNHETSASRTGMSAVYVSLIDSVGNRSSPTEVVVDNLANPGPLSVRVQDDPALGSTQTTLVVTFAVTPQPGSLEVSVGGTSPISFPADTSGTETQVTPVSTSLLSSLPVSIGVRHVDVAGNSVATATFSLTDAQPPAQPSAPALDAAQSVTVSESPTTSLRRPTFVGQAGAVEAGALV
ncbi:MAG: hypothetical protein EB107_13855, partial [Proteobacteria bacterium]|nr:hypothetical protein [Pseudomonadota bacterium]